MIRPIDIRLNAAHPDYPLAEAVTFTGSPSTVLIRGVPPNCGRWAITAVSVAATFPDGSTTTRAAVQSANGVWVATLPATATSGRTANGLRILADGIDENGEAVTGYILGVADFAVASLDVTPAPQPGETSWQMLYFDAVPSVLRKGDVAKIDGVLKFYNGTAWEPFAGDIPAPSTATPAMDGTGAAGTSAAFARGDHVHPTDTSRVPTTRTVNGKALTSDVTLTGADIAVSGTDATKIDAALAGKQDALTAQQLANIAAVPDKLNKSGGTMTGSLTLYEPQNGATLYFPSGGKAKLQFGSGLLNVDDTTGRVTINQKDAAVVDNIPYSLVTKTVANGAVTLDDRAINAVAVSSSLASLTINFPTATSGKARDFAMRLNIAAGVTAPEIAWPQGVTLENNGGEVPEIADGGTGGSSTILYFSETENNGTTAKFLVKGEVVTAIS